ncbi:hypothetical protein ABPG72_000156 [Tetrahymena utriculariae]
MKSNLFISNYFMLAQFSILWEELNKFKLHQNFIKTYGPCEFQPKFQFQVISDFKNSGNQINLVFLQKHVANFFFFNKIFLNYNYKYGIFDGQIESLQLYFNVY